MARLPSNVEASGFRPGEYVGYGPDGVWRIRRDGKSWRACAVNSGRCLYGATLAAVGAMLRPVTHAGSV